MKSEAELNEQYDAMMRRQLNQAQSTILELRQQVAVLTRAVGSRPPTHEIRIDADQWFSKHPLSCDLDKCRKVDSDIAWSLMAEHGTGTYVETAGSGWVKRVES